MGKTKTYHQLLIILVGTIGILSYVIQEAFITHPNNPLQALNLFKYFTVQSNLVAVIYFWLLYSLKIDKKNDHWKNFVGGVVIYTSITFLVFATVLEPLWKETGLNRIGSLSLHYGNPILIIGYVFIHRFHFTFHNKDIWIWIIFPLLYLLFLTIWGVITGDYLYPFLQISQIGVLGYILVIIALISLFFLLSFLVVKILSKK